MQEARALKLVNRGAEAGTQRLESQAVIDGNKAGFSGRLYGEYMPSAYGDINTILGQVSGRNSGGLVNSIAGGGNNGGSGQPNITESTVFTPGQTQASINTAIANNDARSAGSLSDARSSLAGRGYSTNSPLMMALTNQSVAGNNTANNSARTQITSDAAQQNAGQLLNSQVARENQYGKRQSEGIQKLQTIPSLLGAVMGGMSGMS